MLDETPEVQDPTEVQTPETPSVENVEQVTPEVQPEVAPEVAPVEPEVQLQKMPDGRMLTPAAAVQEYAKLQAEFTRKSQENAELKRRLEAPKEPNPWEKPDFQPQSWDEVMRIAAERAKAELKAEQDSLTTRERERAAQLDAEVASVKAIDPALDEERVFTFATKRSEELGITYPSFAAAWKDFKAFEAHEKAIEKRVIEAQKQRAADPVAAAPTTTTTLQEPPEGLSRYEQIQWMAKNIKS